MLAAEGLFVDFASCLGRGPEAPLLMLRGYFDESGHESDKEIVAIGGFVGTAEEWDVFDSDWSAVLRAYDLPYYHASEMGIVEGPLCKGWPKKRMSAFMTDIVSALTRRDLLGVAVAIPMSSYRFVVSSNEWLSKRLGSPYKLCFESCIHAARRFRPDEKLSLVFSSVQEYEDTALAEGLRYVNHELWSGNIDSVAFQRMETHTPLQAADMIGYETYKELERRLNDPQRRPRVTLARLCTEMSIGDRAGGGVNYWDDNSLLDLCADIVTKENGVEAARHLLDVNSQIAARETPNG